MFSHLSYNLFILKSVFIHVFRCFLLLFLFFSVCRTVEAQTIDSVKNASKSHLKIESGILVSDKDVLPYWIGSDNSGRFDDNNADAIYSIISHRSTFNLKRNLALMAGGEAVLTTGDQTHLQFISHYVGFETRSVIGYAGRMVEAFGLNESPLSFGSLIYTNNAKPIPKIVLRTNGWQNVPFLNNRVVQFQAYYAHGWLEKERFQRNAFLHQKYLFARLNLLSERLVISGGIHHNAQWGGRDRTNNLVQPTGWRNYARIVLGENGGSDALDTDQKNALGNHLGNYELSASYDFGSFIVGADFQFLWEDGSGLQIKNWRDGKFGLNLRLKKTSVLDHFLIEVVRTNNQDAIKTAEDGSTYIEPDHFFNNSVYRSGWTYKGRVIGSPLFLVIDDSTEDGTVIQNMINAVRFGFSGSWRQINYQFIFTDFQNHGIFTNRVDPTYTLTTYDVQVEYNHKNQFSVFSRFNYQNGNWVSGSNFGMQLGLVKNLNF